MYSELRFTSSKTHRVIARFDGGSVNSDGGLLLIREADRRLGLTAGASRELVDKRQRGKVAHSCFSNVCMA